VKRLFCLGDRSARPNLLRVRAVKLFLYLLQKDFNKELALMPKYHFQIKRPIFKFTENAGKNNALISAMETYNFQFL
jgi:hypothetical protein